MITYQILKNQSAVTVVNQSAQSNYLVTYHFLLLFGSFKIQIAAAILHLFLT